MRMVFGLAIALSALGCAAFDRNVSKGALAVSSLLIACDASQTIRIASEGWPDNRRESNPVMGERPSVATIITYNIGVIMANIAIWAATPERYKSLPSTALAGIEANVIYQNNMIHGVGYCGQHSVIRR